MTLSMVFHKRVLGCGLINGGSEYPEHDVTFDSTTGKYKIEYTPSSTGYLETALIFAAWKLLIAIRAGGCCWFY